MSISRPKQRDRIVLGAESLGRAIVRMAHQIHERNPNLSRLALIGVRTRGAPLARRLQLEIERISGQTVQVFEIDITSHRDDLARNGARHVHDAPQFDFSVEGLTVVLVDDVLYTARTARAALDALVDRGRPDRVQLAVLIDRGHRELPIRPDYVGKNLPSSRDEDVQVRLVETDGADAVLMVRVGGLVPES